MTRTMTIMAVILMAAVALVPIVADDSDAKDSARFCDSYILSTTYKWIDGTVVRDDCLYYKTSNTEAIDAFEKCIKDREGTLPEDDSRTLKAGDIVRIYYATKDISVNVPISVKTPEGYEDRSQIISSMEMPYPPGLFVKAGDTFSIRIDKAVDNYGKDVMCYVVDNGTVYDLSETYTKTMKTTSEFTFETDSPSGGCNGRFYVDIQYDSSGFSEPSGSAALFAGICAAVTIAIFCILAYAGLKPKWSK
ncbi:MAG: hypothetical protein IKH98_01765 [Candidatus Methanomethylophilaceae archaeon]|nr:hypothetical protein [Candidatus Methanomethylophilaceae archaeon]